MSHKWGWTYSIQYIFKGLEILYVGFPEKFGSSKLFQVKTCSYRTEKLEEQAGKTYLPYSSYKKFSWFCKGQGIHKPNLFQSR